jgi:hypothetical protein
MYFNLYVPRQQAENKRLWIEWKQAFPEFSPVLISSCTPFWFVSTVLSYLNSATSSKDLFAIFMLCFCPIFWLRDTNIYLVFSGLTSRPTSLLAHNKASAFFCGIYVFSQHINIISRGQMLMKYYEIIMQIQINFWTLYIHTYTHIWENIEVTSKLIV